MAAKVADPFDVETRLLVLEIWMSHMAAQMAKLQFGASASEVLQRHRTELWDLMSKGMGLDGLSAEDAKKFEASLRTHADRFYKSMMSSL